MSSFAEEPAEKKQKMNSLSKVPKYRSMADLNFAGYGPIYSRQHLLKNNFKITLTNEEKECFYEIKRAMHESGKAVVVRCAGGWVRDKLLNCFSDDIDLAIDTMTGQEFGECLRLYFDKYKNEKVKIHKIRSNPDKSKHLESVCFRIGNIEFDAVNLRKETYCKDSRVPTMTFGTASEDAFRRDLTINALFYNINSDKIEDFTGKGMDDLIAGIVRTPLDAMVTYKDDPLRILRNLRHGITKLGFDLHGDIIAAAQNEEIHRMLESKVSRERFGIEFDKMLKGKHVFIALHCLVKFGLARILFSIPSNLNLSQSEEEKAWNDSMKITEQITEIWNEQSDKKEEENEQMPKELMFAAFVWPFHSIKYGKKEKSLIMHFVLHSVPGMPNATKLGESAITFCEGTDLFIALLLRLKNEKNVKNEAMSLEVGKFLLLCKENWIFCMCLIKAICKIFYSDIQLSTIQELESWIIHKSNLINCWKWKPLINGHEMLTKYEKYGLAKDVRFGMLNKLMIDERLSKPKITVEEMDKIIIEWLKHNPAPRKKSKKKKKEKK